MLISYAARDQPRPCLDLDHTIGCSYFFIGYIVQRAFWRTAGVLYRKGLVIDITIIDLRSGIQGIAVVAAGTMFIPVHASCRPVHMCSAYIDAIEQIEVPALVRIR